MTEDVTARTSWITTEDEVPLHCYCWQAPSQAGVVAIVHGLGEHAGRYDQWANCFAESGFTVLAPDQQGHGKTTGRRGYLRDYRIFLRDIERLLGRSHEIASGQPVFLYGHSLGGNLVLNYLLRHPSHLAGTIVTSPLLALPIPVPAWKRSSVRVLSHVWPWLNLRSRIDKSSLTHNASICQAWADDDLVFDFISARLATQVFDAADWAMLHASQLTTPALLMHGDQDAVTSWKATTRFAEACPGADLKIWPGQFHELHMELQKREIFDFMLAWMKRRIGSFG